MQVENVSAIVCPLDVPLDRSPTRSEQKGKLEVTAASHRMLEVSRKQRKHHIRWSTSYQVTEFQRKIRKEEAQMILRARTKRETSRAGG